MFSVYCVPADLKMDKGIAPEFCHKYGKLEELQSQKRSVTEAALIQSVNRSVLYLITKQSFFIFYYGIGNTPTANNQTVSLA